MSEMKQLNPANRTAKASAERKRIPMNAPVRKLEVPEIPGYHLHWFAGNRARLSQAERGGYEYVRPEEVELNAVSLGGDSAVSANTDMGSRVSIISGSDERGQPEDLVLMKIKQEWYEEDQKLLETRNDAVASALTGGLAGGEAADAGETGRRYVDKSRTALPAMFTKKRPKPQPPH